MPHSVAFRALGPFALGLAAPLSAQGGLANPAELDRLVADFTGAAVGTAGGARTPVDRRLRLRMCAGGVAAAWHGAPGRTVQLACPGPGGWRIFVDVIAPINRAVPGRAAGIKRGDALTVTVTGQGFAIRRSAEALEAGAVGEWIAVRTAPGAEPVRARIVQPGVAEIPLR